MPCENSVRMVTMCKNDVKKADNLKTYYFKIICFLRLKEFFLFKIYDFCYYNDK